MKRRIKNNEYGFTLIELLAVIVVLAIVLLMGATAVIPRMNDARRQVFSLEANSLIESAEQYLQNNALTGSKPTFPVGINEVCVTLQQLVESGDYTGDSKTYNGKVLVKRKSADSSLYLYTVYLSNGTLMINGKGNADGINVDVKSSDVEDYNESSFGGSACSTSTTGTGGSGS